MSSAFTTTQNPSTPPPPPPQAPHPDDATPTFMPPSVYSSQQMESGEKHELQAVPASALQPKGAENHDAGLARDLFSDDESGDGEEESAGEDPWGRSRSAAMGWATGSGFECRHCSYKYTTETRRPLVLPCGNTFCFMCVNNTIRYPRKTTPGAHPYVLRLSATCKKKHELTGTGTVEDVPKNNQLLELLSIHTPSLTLSSRDGAKEKNLEKKKTTTTGGKEENFKTVAPAGSRPSTATSQSQDRHFATCKKHKNHPEKYFCFMHKEYTCSECSFDKHSACWKNKVDNHNAVVDVGSFSATARENMKKWGKDVGRAVVVVRKKGEEEAARISAHLEDTKVKQLKPGFNERKAKLTEQKEIDKDRVQSQYDRLIENARTILKDREDEIADILDERLDKLAVLQKKIREIKAKSGKDPMGCVEAYVTAAEAARNLETASVSYKKFLESLNFPIQIKRRVEMVARKRKRRRRSVPATGGGDFGCGEERGNGRKKGNENADKRNDWG